jgi:hypothetical protein
MSESTILAIHFLLLAADFRGDSCPGVSESKAN